MLDTSRQSLSSEQPSEPKSLDVALNIAVLYCVSFTHPINK